MMKKSHRWYALLLLRYAKGCTTVVVNATGGGTVIGRTMELGIPLPERASNEIWSLVATQRGEKRFGYAAIAAALGGAAFAPPAFFAAGGIATGAQARSRAHERVRL